MSTSSSLAREALPEKPDQPFPYPNVVSGAPPESGTAIAAASPLDEELIVQREQAAHESGRQQGELLAKTTLDKQLEQARDSIRIALTEFAKERESYYQKVEGEILRLALSIARKILHRESQVDPFFLAGLVRVALEKFDSNTKVSIRVNPLHAADCRDFFSRTMEAQQVPEVIEDPAIEPGRSVLETDLGTSELGIEPQLKEIELGLLDLLAQRPTTTVKP
jgi:flagellar assembly protein FliH